MWGSLCKIARWDWLGATSFGLQDDSLCAPSGSLARALCTSLVTPWQITEQCLSATQGTRQEALPIRMYPGLCLGLVPNHFRREMSPIQFEHGGTCGDMHGFGKGAMASEAMLLIHRRTSLLMAALLKGSSTQQGLVCKKSIEILMGPNPSHSPIKHITVSLYRGPQIKPCYAVLSGSSPPQTLECSSFLVVYHGVPKQTPGRDIPNKELHKSLLVWIRAVQGSVSLQAACFRRLHLWVQQSGRVHTSSSLPYVTLSIPSLQDNCLFMPGRACSSRRHDSFRGFQSLDGTPQAQTADGWPCLLHKRYARKGCSLRQSPESCKSCVSLPSALCTGKGGLKTACVSYSQLGRFEASLEE